MTPDPTDPPSDPPSLLPAWRAHEEAGKAIRQEAAAIAALNSTDPKTAIEALGGALYRSPGFRGERGQMKAVVPRNRSTVAAFHRGIHDGRWHGPQVLSVGDSTAYVKSCRETALQEA